MRSCTNTRTKNGFLNTISCALIGIVLLGLSSNTYSKGYVEGQPLADWRLKSKKKQAGWNKIEKTDRRYLHECVLTACVTTDYELGYVYTVAEGKSEDLAIKRARTVFKSRVFDTNDWRLMLLDHRQAKTQKEFDEFLSKVDINVHNMSGGKIAILKVPMIPDHSRARSRQNDKYIKYYSKEFEISHDLIRSYIDIATNHNSFAESKEGHVGVMLLHPSDSGREGHRIISGIDKRPTKLELYRPGTNIQLGTAYWSELYKNYSYVLDEKARIVLTMIAFTWSYDETNHNFSPDKETTFARVRYQLPQAPKFTRELILEMITDGRIFM